MLSAIRNTLKGEKSMENVSKYKLRVIGQPPVYFNDYETAWRVEKFCLLHGKTAFLMRWDEETEDYAIAV